MRSSFPKISLPVAAEKPSIPELKLLVKNAHAAGKVDAAMVSDPSVVGLYEQTPLWVSVRAGHLYAVKILLEHGANPTLTCTHPECPTPL